MVVANHPRDVPVGLASVVTCAQSSFGLDLQMPHNYPMQLHQVELTRAMSVSDSTPTCTSVAECAPSILGSWPVLSWTDTLNVLTVFILTHSLSEHPIQK